MPDLMKALRAADAAGDTDSARRIAIMIRDQSQQQQPEQQPVNNLDVPAGGEGPAFPERPVQPERTLGEVAEGVGEAALTTLTGATTGALGFGVGTVGGIIGELTGMLKPGEGLELAQELGSMLTKDPTSEAGKEYVKDIGETLGVLPPVLGTGPVVGLNALSKVKLTEFKSPLAKKISEESTGAVKKSFEKKLGDDKFTPRVFALTKEAQKQGFSEGMTNIIANAKPIDKRRMRQQLSIVEKGLTDDLFSAENRAGDIAGNSLLRKIDFVKANNTQAGKQLGRVAENLKKTEIDISDPIDSFIRKAENLGVTFDDNLKPNFKGSEIETFPPARKLIKDITTSLANNPVDNGFRAHKFKKFIDKGVTFGKADRKLDADVESMAKSLRSDVNDAIRFISDDYKEANIRFKDTIEALNSVQDAAGSKLKFFDKNAEKAVGVKLRNLMNNTNGRANLMNAIEDIEVTAQKYGGSFDDHILTQTLFADQLDAMFGSGARTSLRGEVKKAGVDTAVDVAQMTTIGMLATGVKAANKRIQGVNKKNQLKAIKALLK